MKNTNNFRIYLEGRGLGGYRPLLGWIYNNVPMREDRNGNEFVFLNDLLPHKGKRVGTNIHNHMEVALNNLLVDGVIAFGEVKKIADELKNNDEFMQALKPNYRQYINKRHLGYAWLHNSEVMNPYLKKYGLEDWF